MTASGATSASADLDLPRRIRSGVSLAIAGTFLFAMKSIWIKSAFASGGNATLLLTLRMTLAAPFFAAMLIYLRKTKSAERPSQRRDFAYATLLGFLGYYLASFLDMSGLELISAQLERLTLFTYPTMIAILAWLFLGETLNRSILLALLLCYVGIFLMGAREHSQSTGHHVVLGVVLVLASALSYSSYVILAKPLIERIGSREFTSCAMLGSMGFTVAHYLVTQPMELAEVSLELWSYGLLLAFVCTVIPSYLVNEAIARIGATRTTIIGSVGPVLTMLLAVTLLDEPTSVWHFLGMGLVIAGVSLVSRR